MPVAEYELYKRIKLLGEGSFGKAYLVECLSDGSLCVIKQVDISRMSEQEKKDTLIEAKILEALQHPNIVRFREVYKTKKGRLCIVMDYADGGDLGQKIKERKGQAFLESQILDWFTQICLALKHVHDKKIIHRDLKCQNIFLTSDNMVKLGDFGIARMLSNTRENAKTLVGTPYYLSPEIIENKPYSFKSDIWALGVILYELCALKPPFTGDSLPFLALKIVRGAYSPIPSHFSKDLKNLVASLLQTDPNKRLNINNILALNFIQARIKNFLSESTLLAEFPLLAESKQVEAETKTVENTKKVSSPGTMLSKMGLKPKQQYQPKVQRVIQVQQHDENSLFDNNAFQIPGVYEQKQLVDLVNVRSPVGAKKNEEKPALIAKQLNHHGLKQDFSRNPLISKPKGISAQIKALEQKNIKAAGNIEKAKVADHDSATDKSKIKYKPWQKNEAKKPMSPGIGGDEALPFEEEKKQNIPKNQKHVPLHHVPKVADNWQSKDGNSSVEAKVQEKKNGEDVAAKKEEMEKKRAEKEKERLALRQQMQQDIRNKRNQLKQAKGDFKVEFMMPGVEDQLSTTNTTVPTEETPVETQNSETINYNSVPVETKNDWKTASLVSKAKEYSSVGTVRNNENHESKKVDNDKSRSAFRQHLLQSKRNSKRQGKDFVVEFCGIKIDENNTEEPTTENKESDLTETKISQPETDLEPQKGDKESNHNASEEVAEQATQSTNLTDSRDCKHEEENCEKQACLPEDFATDVSQHAEETEEVSEEKEESKSEEEPEKLSQQSSNPHHSKDEVSVEESKENEEDEEQIPQTEEEEEAETTESHQDHEESQNLESTHEYSSNNSECPANESTKTTGKYEDREDFEDELQTHRREEVTLSREQLMADFLKDKEEMKESEGLDFKMSDYNKLENLKIFMEESLGDEVFLKAYWILKDLFHKRADIDEIEKKYAQDNYYESLFPFIPKDSRVKYLPLMFTFVIMEDIAEESSAQNTC